MLLLGENNEVEKSLIDVVNVLRAKSQDEGSKDEFPSKNYDYLINADIHKLTVPNQFGGYEYGFEQTSRVISQLAMGCPSTALCMAMHFYTVAGLAKTLTSDQQAVIFGQISEGHFTTSFNQPNVSIVQANQDLSQSTELEIQKCETGYIINGVKRSVSGINRFTYLPVYGNQKEDRHSRFGITALLATVDDSGVSVKNSWDCDSMRMTGSHDVLFKDVHIPHDRLIGREGFGIEDTTPLVFWSRLAISSVYLGIAKAALDYVIQLAKVTTDKISKKRIAFMPGTQFAIAEMRIKFDAANSQLVTYARQADEFAKSGKYTDDLFQKALMTKYFVTHTSNEIVWQAMQVAGMKSLNKNNLLNRLYQDVRAATFHQPNDDLLKELLAKKTLGLIAPKNRWL
ncbi:acyl-CoA dehydrogenase family protein [Paenibacillus lautus]|uniref:acyl-CoA dehydrogenase family protein n=1 Tax=Paenibacillus lautus TaxID=1401 RepID=UPI003D270AA5